MSFIVKFSIWFGVAYIAVISVMYIFQRRIMYLPLRRMGTPEEHGLVGVRHVALSTMDNVELSSWFKPAEEGKETVVYFHGNWGNLGTIYRQRKFSSFINRGFGLLAISYRGYGTSKGRPSEKGLYHDARAAVEHLHNLGIAFDKIVFYGESLGSGVATQMALEYPKVRALVLEAPYTSVIGRAAEIYPWIPIRRLLKDKFDSLSKIPNVKMPILILHGELDQKIPISHGRKMLEAASEPKKGVFFPHIHHVDFEPEAIAENLVDFLKEQQKS